jgi:alanyl-tRNA synthetase
VHIVPQLPGEPGSTFRAVVNHSRRRLTANNHTATHLLDHALREVLGKHVEQKGSLVNADYLRFDFSHFGKMTREELDKVEQTVNRMIRSNLRQEALTEVPFDKARKMGAIALFGEKYGDTVRVIRFGESVELCGGTHVPFTGQIAQFIILSESAISAGVRRMEAITGDRADEYIREKMLELSETRALFSQSKDVRKSVENLLEENSRLAKKLEDLERLEVARIKQELKNSVTRVGGVNLITGMPALGSAQVKRRNCRCFPGAGCRNRRETASDGHDR